MYNGSMVATNVLIIMLKLIIKEIYVLIMAEKPYDAMNSQMVYNSDKGVYELN